jgi:hypothetical protein
LFAGFSGVDARCKHLQCAGSINSLNQLPRLGGIQQTQRPLPRAGYQPLSGFMPIAPGQQPFDMQLEFALIQFVFIAQANLTGGVAWVFGVPLGGGVVFRP